jgi:signal peptidase I
VEARLFLLSLWCGLYGQVVRFARRRAPDGLGRWPTTIVNGIFWATGSVMGGMLVASYTEKMDITFEYAALFGAAGFVIGCLIGYWKGARADSSETLIQDNLEWADTGFSAILLASIVMFFVVQAFKIPSGSMRMTFIEGDHLFVNKFIYGLPIPFTEKKVAALRSIAVNDIVIFRFPARSKSDQHYGKDFIKRCIALEGQQVKIVDKRVFVDGVPREEPFKREVDGFSYEPLKMPPADYQKAWEAGEFADMGTNQVRDNFGPVVVPPGHIFVMGDNRDRSFDGRFWGPLKESAVKGRAWFLYFPFSRARVAK